MQMLIQKPNKIRVNHYDYVLFFLILLRYLLPPFFSNMVEDIGVLDLLLTGVSFVATIYLLVRSKKVFTFPIILFALFCGSLVVSTFLGRAEFFTALVHAAEVGLLCLVVNVALYDEEKGVAFLLVVRDAAGAFALLNLLLMALVPAGIPVFTTDAEFPFFLYGNVNSTIKYVIAGLCCAVLIDAKFHKKISIATAALLINVFFMAATVYFTATAVLGELFILAWILMRPLLEKRSRIFYALVVLFVIFIELAVVIFFDSSGIAPLIAKVFHKTPTFSNRSELWHRTWNGILRSPLIGHGLQNEDTLARNTGNFFGSHNYYLDILYQRGMIGFSFLALIILAPLWKLKRSVRLSRTTYILMGFCCACLIMFLAEPFFTSEYMILPMFYAFVAMVYKDAGSRTWELKWQGEGIVRYVRNTKTYERIAGKRRNESK